VLRAPETRLRMLVAALDGVVPSTIDPRPSGSDLLDAWLR